MRYIRIVFLITFTTGLLVLGYLRERYLLLFDSHTIFSFVKKYPRVSATSFKNEMSNLWLLKLSPKLLSSILYSITFALLVSLIVYLFTKNKLLSYLTMSVYATFMLICFSLIIIGNMGVSYHLSYGLSHYLEDLFLSPIILMMILPITFFQQRKNKFENR